MTESDPATHANPHNNHGAPSAHHPPYSLNNVSVTLQAQPQTPGIALPPTQAYIGPYCPGLTSAMAMVSAFRAVIDYRRYRLQATPSHLLTQKSAALVQMRLQINGLFPPLEPYDRKEPITLLTLLSLFLEVYIGMNISEGRAVRVLSYDLDGETKVVYIQQNSSATSEVADALTRNWPHVIHSQILKFLRDNVLHEEYFTPSHTRSCANTKKRPPSPCVSPG